MLLILLPHRHNDRRKAVVTLSYYTSTNPRLLICGQTQLPVAGGGRGGGFRNLQEIHRCKPRSAKRLERISQWAKDSIDRTFLAGSPLPKCQRDKILPFSGTNDSVLRSNLSTPFLRSYLVRISHKLKFFPNYQTPKKSNQNNCQTSQSSVSRAGQL